MARETVERGISYDKEKGLYYVLLSSGTNAEGKSSKSYVTTKKITEARKLRKEHLAKKQRGEVLPASSETLVQHAEDFINFKALNLAESTIYSYRGMLKNHIKPYFKNKKIQDVQARDLEKYILKTSKNVCTSTVRKHMDLLHAVFEDAKKKQIVKVNPTDLIDQLKVEKKEKVCYNEAETRKLLESLKGTSIEIPVYLAIFLGLRRGEVAGLRWEDVDFENRTITVRNSRVQVGKEIIEKKPKTAKSQRTLLMPDVLCKILLQEKNRKPTARSMAESSQRSKYVATTRKGEPFRPNDMAERFNKHLKKHGLKHIRFHDLRHTFASIAANNGVNVYEVSQSLGHANVHVTTSVYLHEFDPVKSGAVMKVAESLKLNENEA